MDFTNAIHALRLARDENASIGHEPVSWFLVDAAIAALDAARGQAVAYALPKALAETRADGFTVVRAGHQHYADGTYCVPLYAAPPAAAVAAENVTPMRQPRADLARLVESINAAVYANGDGLSVTEAIGALELAKLELLKEQEQ